MIELIRMTEEEFEPFMELSQADHIRGQVQAGYWQPEEGQAKMQQMVARFLPQGMDTPGMNFFTIHDPDSGENVGALWYWITEREGQKLVFVMDIQVYEDFKRRGYGSQAFQVMERQALEMGIKTVALSVFSHNTPARSMYEKLGYVGEGESMMKEIRD